MRNRQFVRLGIILMLGLILSLGVAGPAIAADGRGGDLVTIGKDEVINDDLFLSGNQVEMNGTVNGDLFVAASDVRINGTVNGSLFVGGATVMVNGPVSGSLYGGAGSLVMGPQAVVGRNALAVLYSLKTEAGANVKRDLWAVGYQAMLGGLIGRDVKFGGAALELNGKVGRDVQAGVSEPNVARAPTYTSFGRDMPPAIAPGLRVSREASIGGKLVYESSVDQASAIQAQPAGGVEFKYQAPAQARTPQQGRNVLWDTAGWVLELLREFATLLVLGLLALWKLPELVAALVARAQSRPLPATGWGLVVLIGGFVVAFIATIVIILLAVFFGVVTLGGLAWTILSLGFSTLGVLFAVFMLIVSYGAKIVVAYLFGRLILAQFKYDDHRIWALVVGVAVLVLVTSIPVLGGLIGLAATLVGLGAMWLYGREQRLQVAVTSSAAPAA